MASRQHRLSIGGSMFMMAAPCEIKRPIRRYFSFSSLALCTGRCGTTASSPLKKDFNNSFHTLVKKSLVNPPKSSPLSPMNSTLSSLDVMSGSSYTRKASSTKMLLDIVIVSSPLKDLVKERNPAEKNRFQIL